MDPQRLVDRAFAERLRCAENRVFIVPREMKMERYVEFTFMVRVESAEKAAWTALALAQDVLIAVKRGACIYVSQPFFGTKGNITYLGVHYLRCLSLYESPEGVFSRL
jgi:hypothetical protein